MSKKYRGNWEFVGDLSNTIVEKRDTRRSTSMRTVTAPKTDDGALSSGASSLLSRTLISCIVLLRGL